MGDGDGLSDEQVLEAIGAALEAGDRDRLGGGIVAADLVDRLPICFRQVQKRLTRLDDTGRLTKVYGANPETNEARKSYLPTDHPDAGTPEEQY